MRAVITGVGGPAGRGLASALHEAGHDVLGTDMQAVDGLPFGSCLIPPANDDAFVTELVAAASAWAADFIVPTVSEELTVAQLHSITTTRVAVTALAAARIAADKWLTTQALQLAGVPVPITVPVAELTDEDIDVLGRPFLVKPRFGRGARGVQVVETATGLDHPDLLAQEFAPGQEYAVDVFVSPSSGRVVECVVFEKLALTGGNIGNGLQVAVRDHADVMDVAELAAAAVTAIGLTGPADIDIRRRTNGQPVVLEINARVGAHIGHAPSIWRSIVDAYGGPAL